MLINSLDLITYWLDTLTKLGSLVHCIYNSIEKFGIRKVLFIKGALNLYLKSYKDFYFFQRVLNQNYQAAQLFSMLKIIIKLI